MFTNTCRVSLNFHPAIHGSIIGDRRPDNTWPVRWDDGVIEAVHEIAMTRIRTPATHERESVQMAKAADRLCKGWAESDLEHEAHLRSDEEAAFQVGGEYFGER